MKSLLSLSIAVAVTVLDFVIGLAEKPPAVLDMKGNVVLPFMCIICGIRVVAYKWISKAGFVLDCIGG